MKTSNWIQAALAVAVISAATAIAQVQATDATVTTAAEKQVVARLAEIQAAAQKLDANELFGFVLENDKGALIEDGLLLLTRAEALDSTKQAFVGVKKLSYRFDQQHIKLLTPTIALAVGTGVSSANLADGRAVEIPFAQSVVLVLTDGEWKVVHAHRSAP